MIYSVSSELYLEVAARLAEAVGGRKLLFGFAHVPFRRHGMPADGLGDRLPETRAFARRRPGRDRPTLVPVWWEFHTTGDGGEVLNDFSFSDLRACL